jgi:hypothetical protein
MPRQQRHVVFREGQGPSLAHLIVDLLDLGGIPAPGLEPQW